MRVKIYICCVVWLLLASCKERYTPPVSSPVTGYLVVEGFINNGIEPTSITLSRTTGLEDSSVVVYEHGAQVFIESNDGNSYGLTETGNGVYTAQGQLMNNNQYRLHIVTADGKEYESDYSSVKNTPPIDTISWQRDDSGIHLSVDTHDPLNNPGYYQWNYTQTWQFETYQRTLVYAKNPSTGLIDSLVYWDPVTHRPDTTIFRCWKTYPSTDILIGSTEKLTNNVMTMPLLNIAAGSQQLSILYSLIVTQHAISRDHYEFLQKMKKNTEQLGSLFDAQPSELKGNLHCVTDANEIVIGYIEVSGEQTHRIFISNAEVSNWNYNAGCTVQIIDNDVESMNSKGSGLYPTTPHEMVQRSIKNFNAYQPDCVDCTLTGSNKKPPFWP